MLTFQRWYKQRLVAEIDIRRMAALQPVNHLQRRLRQAVAANGAGPRHMAFHPNGAYGYVVNELDSTVDVWALNNVIQADAILFQRWYKQRLVAEIDIRRMAALQPVNHHGTLSLAGEAPLPGSPTHISTDRQGNYLFCGSYNEHLAGHIRDLQ
jgi:6-phosphogluconolactonase (cycloisomerase 2 family)